MPITGALVVVVSDSDPALPAGTLKAQAITSVTVTGPNGYSKNLEGNGTYTLTNLQPGVYTVTGPSGQISTFTVVAGQTAQGGTITLSGVAQLGYAGLPDGVKPTLKLSSSAGAMYRIPADLTVRDLRPGTYVLKAADVRAGGFAYHAESVTFDVQIDQTSTPSLDFAAIDGRVTVSVLAASGVIPDVTLSGPDGFTQSFTTPGDVTLDDLAPGEYHLSAKAATLDGFTYAPTTSPTTFTLKAGETAQVTAAYGVSTAKLNVTVTGAPAATTPSLTLRGANGATTNVPTDGHLTGLAAGEYTLSGADLDAGGFTFRAADVPVTLMAGAKGSASLTYAPVDGRATITVNAPANSSPAVTLTAAGSMGTP